MSTGQSNTKSRRFTHRVVRIRDGSNCGNHTSGALAEKRRGRLVAMSNGKLTPADFRIEVQS